MNWEPAEGTATGVDVLLLRIVMVIDPRLWPAEFVTFTKNPATRRVSVHFPSESVFVEVPTVDLTSFTEPTTFAIVRVALAIGFWLESLSTPLTLTVAVEEDVDVELDPASNASKL